MLFSFDWLSQYVDPRADVSAVAERLTAAGLAVEGIEQRVGDALLDVDVTTNRPDCMNHFGLAREVAVAFGRPLSAPEVKVEESARVASEADALGSVWAQEWQSLGSNEASNGRVTAAIDSLRSVVRSDIKALK